MLAYYSILCQKRAVMLYIRGRSTPVCLQPYPSIFSSALINKLKSAPININSIKL